MAFSLIEKTDLLKKVRLPSEKAELQSALDSGGDKAKWFYDEKKFSWPQGSQIVLKASASVIKDLKSAYSSKPKKSSNTSATYNIGRQTVKFEATGKTGDDVSAATMTRMQELGSAYIFKRAIEDNQEYKKPQDIMDDKDAMKELKRIWKSIGKLDEVDEQWIESFYAQQDALLKKIGRPKFTKFNREGGFMEYVTDVVKKFGISSKDNWDPADVWLIEDEDQARTLIDKVLNRGKGKTTMSRLSEFNAIMRILFNTKKVFGISLKKVAKGQPARIEFLNHSQKFLKSLDSIHMSYSYSKCGMGTKKDKGGNTVISSQDTRFVVVSESGATYDFQIKANDSTKFSGLKYEPTASGASAARLGKATIELVIDQMEGYNLSFNKSKEAYAKTPDDFLAQESEIKGMIKNLKNAGVDLGVKDEQEAYDNLLFSMNTQPYVANSKLQQITWLDQVLSLSKQERDEFATDMIFIAKKEGSRYGPFAKIF
tara:strand:- start:1215 stop:2666 length:1452 start_codon:yes stop_codon:yes gene_type:complete